MQDHAKSLTSIFSLLETGPAQLSLYSIKQITWGNIKMVIKYRVEELDDVYWAQARTMLFEGLHKVNLEIIKHRVISISSRMMLISDLFSSCPCHFLASIQIQLIMHLAIHSCKWATPPLAHQDIIMLAWFSLRGASSALSNDDIRRPCVWAGEGKCPICIYFHPPIFGGPHCISTSCFLFSVGTAD